MDPFATSLPAASAIAFLVALAWKSSLVLAAAWLVSSLLVRRSAALRHGVWTLAVGALLVLPLVQAVAPPLPVALPVESKIERVEAPTSLVVTPRAELVPAPASSSAGGTVATAPVKPDARQLAWPHFVLLAWLAGVVAVLAFFATGRIALRRLARNARPLVDEAWLALAREVAWSQHLRRLPRFLVLDDATSPLTWGVFRPTILLPAAAADWPVEQRRAFLVHELAHVARRDCAIQEVAHVVCALYWFHPGAWFAAHRLRVEREPACDDLVLADGAVAEAYAHQLLEVVRAGRVPRAALSLSGAAMAAPSRLEARVRALLDDGRDRRSVGRRRTIVTSAVALAMLLPLAAVVPATSKETVAKPTAATKSGNLAKRWELAVRDGDKPFWFAYSIAFDGGRDGKEVLLSDSEGWNAEDLEKRGTTLADRLGCGEQDAVILVRVSKQGIVAFDRVALRNAHLSPDLGGIGVIAIGSIGTDESLDWLAARLREAPEDRRAAVIVSAVALHPGERAERMLEEILKGPRGDDVRTQAAEGFERHPGARALALLEKTARSDKSVDVRREAAETIGDLDYEPATATLITLVRELDDAQVRSEAVESLGEREPARVVPVLVAVADDDDEEEFVRREAVETLGDLPNNAGLEALRKMAMGHPDPGVRSEAVETLNEIGLRAEQAAKGH